MPSVPIRCASYLVKDNWPMQMDRRPKTDDLRRSLRSLEARLDIIDQGVTSMDDRDPLSLLNLAADPESQVVVAERF